MRIQKANYKPESCWRICFPLLPLPTVVHTLSATKCVCKGIWKPKHFRGAIKKTKTTTFGMWQVAKPFWYICSTVESWYGKHIGISKKKLSIFSITGSVWRLKTFQRLDLHRFGFLVPISSRGLGGNVWFLGPEMCRYFLIIIVYIKMYMLKIYIYMLKYIFVYVLFGWLLVIVVCFCMDLLVIISVNKTHVLVSNKWPDFTKNKGKINSKPPWPAHGPRLPWWRPTPHNCTTCPKGLPGEKKTMDMKMSPLPVANSTVEAWYVF